MNDPNLTGVLVIDKEKGPTSHDIVASLRRIVGMRRIGHCGTLDPLATGVLVLCLGRFTRLNRWLNGADKEYLATIFLGATSRTGDAQGPIIAASNVQPPAEGDLASALDALTGEIDQVPPDFSAVKVGGVRSYKRARRGEEIALKARRVKIATINLISYEFPKVVVRVQCSSGTYIRSLAQDLGRALETGAYLADLRRLRVGNLGLDMALTMDQVFVQHKAGRLVDAFAHPRQALGELATIELNPDELVEFTHGKAVESPSLNGVQRDICAVFDSSETLFGIGRYENGLLRPFCVLRSHQASA